MSMNCLEFRRAIAVQPRQLDARARQHRDECPRCAEAHARALSFEAVLDRSLAIPVPDTLADRILLAQSTLSRQQTVGRRTLIWRAAAGLALAVGVASVSWLALGPQQTLAAMAAQHLAHEPMSLTAQGVLPGVVVDAAFKEVGVHLRASPGDISYLRLCPLGLRRSVHMVMQKPGGAVTVMYVPGAKAARGDFNERGIIGREVPIGDGVLVMLASSSSDFDSVEAGFRAVL